MRSVDNFGKLGEPPSHPELLDWLATSLVADGWSLKKLHKRIMLSRTYQMSTAWNEQAARHRSRKPSALCDAATAGWKPRCCATRCWPRAVSSTRPCGGTTIATTPFENLTATGTALKPELYQSTRRSVYLPVLRSAVYDLFQAYDFPDPAVPNGDRATTTVAGQALFMMNGSDRGTGLRPPGRSDPERCEPRRPGPHGRAVPAHLRSARGSARNARNGRAFLDQYQAARSLAGERRERRRRLAWKGSVQGFAVFQ